MEFLLLLILLGLIAYFLIRHRAASLTRTPVWLLWLVMMTPALIWSGWILLQGEDTPMPPVLILVLLGAIVVCPIAYWLLIRWGRHEQNPTQSQTQNPPASQKASTVNQPVVKGDVIASVKEKSKVRPITKQEETELRNCFPWGVYYLQNVEYLPQAVLCRGKLRTNPETAYKTVRKNIEAEFGDRFFVVFQENLSGKPFFALVPNPQARKPSQTLTEPVTKPGLALGLMMITLFTTTLVGVQLALEEPFPRDEVHQILSDPTLLLLGLPYAISLMAILSIHELGHYLTAVYYKIRATLPYFIPVPFFLGTFGAFIQMRSPVPNRKALFDVSLAGPVAGLVATLPLLLWGLSQSQVVALSDTSGLLNFESLDPRFSGLLTLLSKWALGDQLTPQMAIHLHPVAVAGYLGLVVTALNLMPVGQLDGGHIVHAMFGQRTGAAIGQITRLLVLVLAFFIEQDLRWWAVLLFFLPVIDEPALNDVSELDNWRDLSGFLALLLLVSIVLPLPPVIGQLLNV